MGEMNSYASIPTIESTAIGPLLDTSSYYGYGTGSGDCYTTADAAYRISPPRPAWVQEGGYEFENNTGAFPADTSWATRRTRFWNSLAGGTAGDGFGSRDAWQWLNFPSGLSTPGATYSTKAFDLFATLPWWDLRPSGTGAGFAGRTLIASGGGSGASKVTSSVTSDGVWLLAYIPGSNAGTGAVSITVDMAALSATATARWWNPVSGAYTLIGSGYASSGTRTFTTPGANGVGNDWVLVLNANAAARCGTIDASGLYSAPQTVPVSVTCQVSATLQSNASVVATAMVNLH
jgi:hypothetical protein